MNKIRGNVVGTNISVDRIADRMGSDEISGISILINELKNGYFNITNKSFEQGSVYPGKGFVNSETTIRLKRAIFVKSGTVVSYENNAPMPFCWDCSVYREAECINLIEGSGWNSMVPYTVTNDGYLHITFVDIYGSSIIPDNLGGRIRVEVKDRISDVIEDVAGLIDPTLSNEGKAADAKAVGDRFSDIIKEIESYPNVCVERTNNGTVDLAQRVKLAYSDHAILIVPDDSADDKSYIRIWRDLSAVSARFMRVENDLVETVEMRSADIPPDDSGEGTSTVITFNTHKIIGIDDTLSEEGKAADAKAVGDAIGDIGAALDELHAYAQALVGGGG